MRPRRLLTRGEVWQADLDPIAGREQGGTRPVIIVSSNHFNLNLARMIVVVSVTRTDRENPLHVPIDPPDGGLRHPSVALCDMVGAISSDRLHYFIGRLDRSTLDQVTDRLRIILDI